MSLEAHHRFIIDTMSRNTEIARNIINELEAENARLKAELERLRASSFVTAVPVEEYERLREAGDAMAEELIGIYFGNRLVTDWNAAKEGKQP